MIIPNKKRRAYTNEYTTVSPEATDAKPINTWHPIDTFSRALYGISPEEELRVDAEAHIAAEYLGHVESGVRGVIDSLLGQGVPDIEAALGNIGAVLTATARAALLIKGHTEIQIDYFVESGMSDERVLAALAQIQRGHGGAS